MTCQWCWKNFHKKKGKQSSRVS
uniref:Uncharacterized protein n=1 Tax=Arundo donax TaxID=35708 RepID=A0A0A8XUT7_ARUDO